MAMALSVECAMKTLGKIEAAICLEMVRFAQMDRGPKDIRTNLIGDLPVVHLAGVLTTTKQQLVWTLPIEKGRDRIKQVQTHPIDTDRLLMDAMIEGVAPCKVKCLIELVGRPTAEDVTCHLHRRARQQPPPQGRREYRINH